MRCLRLVHSLPTRTRLLASWLRRDARAATQLAEALAREPGVREVRVRLSTGSLVCDHEPAVTGEALLLAAARLGQPELVLRPGERPPIPPPPATSSVAREAARFFRELDAEVLRVTEGRADLGLLTTLGFFGAGALEVAVDGKLPMPPWFNLAWWGFRTFVTTEGRAIEASRVPGATPAKDAG